MPDLNDLSGIDYYLSLFDQLDNQTIVITANARLKEHLTQLYLEYGYKQKQIVLLRESFMNLDGFVNALYSKAQMINFQLENIITDDEARFLLLSYMKEDKDVFMPSIKQAKLVFSAWQLLQNWCLHTENIDNESGNINVDFFLKWIKRYQTKMNNHRWIDQSQCLLKLLNHPKTLQQAFLKLHWHKVIFVGFDTFTPLMETFIKHCQINLQILVTRWSLADCYTKITLTEYLEDKLEIKKIAQKVFELSQSDHNGRIGVIVPDLQAQFNTLVSTFDQYFVLEEDKHNPLLDNTSRQYSISGGQNLLDQPIVYQLMLWLKFNKISRFDDIALMLGSSYLKGYKLYKSQRLQHIIELKGKVPECINFAELVKSNLFKNNCDPVLLEVIAQINNRGENQQKFSALTFGQVLKQMINKLGYLENCKLSSLEHQAFAEFYALLNKLLMLTRLEVMLTFDEWLMELQHMVSSTIFQTQTTTKPRVQILGMLEATEIYFDYLFVIRMSDSNWPSISSMNPYLPLILQRTQYMPHSSSERELEITQTISKRLMKQARTIFFSYGLFNEEKSQTLSPLLRSLAEVVSDHAATQKSSAIMVHAQVFNDNTLTKMSKQERKQLTGGSQLFKNIAECPYRAALIHRLQISPDKTHKPILSPLEKGVVIHHVLEQIWCELKSSENLLNTSDKVLSIAIETHIKSALNQHVALLSLLPQLMKNVEIKRLKEVLLQWFSYEKSRQEAFEVLALEKEIKYTLEGISFKLRLDRVDRLISNHTIVIDYKTSKQYQIDNLLKVPISEPQLPLYAIYENADAVAIATINGAKIGLQSISSIDDWIKEGEPKAYPAKKIADDMPKNYSALKKHWQNELDRQITGFIQGESLVTPSAQSCLYCEFSIVCRMSYFSPVNRSNYNVDGKNRLCYSSRPNHSFMPGI